MMPEIYACVFVFKNRR